MTSDELRSNDHIAQEIEDACNGIDMAAEPELWEATLRLAVERLRLSRQVPPSGVHVWFRCDESLPELGEFVLIRTGLHHRCRVTRPGALITDAVWSDPWPCYVARRVKKSPEANDMADWRWDIFGGEEWSHEMTHWARITNIPEAEPANKPWQTADRAGKDGENA